MKIQDIVYNRWNRMVIVSQFTQNWGEEEEERGNIK